MEDLYSEHIEITIAKLLSDYEIRVKTARYFEDWMFSLVGVRSYISVILSPSNINKHLDGNIICTTIKQTQRGKKLDKTDWKEIFGILRAAPITSDCLGAAIEICTSFITNCLSMRGANAFAEGKNKEAQEYMLRSMSFRMEDDNFFDPTDPFLVKKFRDEDLPQSGQGWKSSINLINEISTYHGYKPRDLVMVVAPPKKGKTTFLSQEGATLASQGRKIAHIILGDMSSFDIISRYYINLTGCTPYDLINNPDLYIKKVKNVMERVRISVHPSMSKTVQDIIAELKTLYKKFKFDVFIIDYDSNIIPPSDTLYESGGLVYALLKGFAEETNTLCFIASQPKIGKWNDEELTADSASDSSKKQHHCDYMITINRNPKARRVGTIHLPLVRRGDSGVKRWVEFNDHKFHIREISKEEYDLIVNEVESDKYVNKDIIIP